MPAGRPSKYTRELGLEICRRISLGELLIDICESPGMPAHDTVIGWKQKHEEFRLSYVRAREEQQHTFADKILKRAFDESRDYTEVVTERLNRAGEITAIVTEKKSDNTAVQRDRLICDNMKFLMARLAANVYAEHQKVEHTGVNGGPVQYQEIVDRPIKETPEEWQARVQKQLELRKNPPVVQ